MKRPWHEISSPDDERWTPATWLVFAGLTLFFASCLWFATGLGPAWLRSLGMGAGVTAQATEVGGSRMAVFPMFVMTMIFFVPLVMSMLPSLGILLWLMKRAGRRRPQGRPSRRT